MARSEERDDAEEIINRLAPFILTILREKFAAELENEARQLEYQGLPMCSGLRYGAQILRGAHRGALRGRGHVANLQRIADACTVVEAEEA